MMVGVKLARNLRGSTCGLQVLALLLGLTSVVVAYNIDENNPSVLQPLTKRGIDFGFSVAQYMEGDQRRLLVGAPRDNTSFQYAGALYSCDLDNFQCDKMNVPEEGYSSIMTEDHNYQGLGFAVASDGGKNIVGCAPRWQAYETTMSRHMDFPFGICFAADSSDNIFQSFSPPTVDVNFASLNFMNNGSCQFGMTAAFMKGRDTMTFGSPGCWNWQGDAWEIPIDSVKNLNTLKSTLRRVGQLPLSDLDLVEGGSSGYEAVTDLYLGYSVASINYNGIPAIVSAMPRIISTNKLKVEEKDTTVGPMVYIFEEDSKMGNKLKVLDKIKPPKPKDTAKYESSNNKFTFFGYSLATLDVNGDSYEDLVVGAPLYNNATHYDQGAIFVYLQKRFKGMGDASEGEEAMMELEGDKLRTGTESFGRFGSCVAALGDIDSDGYEDLAVGAPYMQGGGAVFIYMGGRAGLQEDAKQVIRPSILNGLLGRDVFGFGTTITQRLPKLSGSGYDVAIGAPESDVVVVLSSQIVVNFYWNLTFSGKMDVQNPACDYREEKLPCVHAKVCFLYTTPRTSGPRLSHRLDFSLLINGDFRQTPPRILFDSGSSSTTVSMGLQEGSHRCQDLRVLGKKDIENMVEPFLFEEVAELQTKDTTEAVLNSSLVMTKVDELYMVISCKNEEVKECQSDISLTYEIREEYKFGSSQSVKILFSVENSGETAYNTRLEITTNGDLEAQNTEGDIQCSNSEGVSVISCSIKTVVSGAKKEILLSMVTTEKFAGSTDDHEAYFEIKAEIQTSSALVNPENAIQDFQVPIIVSGILDLSKVGSFPSVVSYNGSDYYRSPAPGVTEEQLGPEIIHRYKIYNRNQYSIYAAQITINWPLKIDGMYLLYLLEGPSSPVITKCVYSNGEKDPYSIAQQDSGTAGERSAQSGSDTPTNAHPAALNSGGVQSVLGKSFDYMKIICDISEMMEDEEIDIELRSRLVQRSLTELGVGSDVNNVTSEAWLQVSRLPLNAPPPPASQVYYLTTAISYQYAAPEWVIPWWIIVVSVVGGLLVLVIIGVLLWKCGFFKRKRVINGETDDTQETESMIQEGTKDKEQGKDAEELMITSMDDPEPRTPHTPTMRLTMNATDDFHFESAAGYGKQET